MIMTSRISEGLGLELQVIISTEYCFAVKNQAPNSQKWYQTEIHLDGFGNVALYDSWVALDALWSSDESSCVSSY